jgi:ABC-type antimicrobial peptide transport system permease subunit
MLNIPRVFRAKDLSTWNELNLNSFYKGKDKYIYVIVDKNTRQFIYKRPYLKSYDAYYWHNKKIYNNYNPKQALITLNALKEKRPELLEGREIIIALYRTVPVGVYLDYNNYVEERKEFMKLKKWKSHEEAPDLDSDDRYIEYLDGLSDPFEADPTKFL